MIIGIDASRANVTQRTGTERYAYEVIRRLPVLWPEATFRLYVREPLRTDFSFDTPNVQVVVLSWPPKILWSHLRLAWELFWHAPDVLFVPADTVPLIHPKRTITTIHDIAFERFPELYRGKSVQRSMGLLRPIVHALVRLATLGRYSASERDYHRWSARHALRTCPRILTVSQFSKQELMTLLHAGADQVAVTPLGVEQADFFSRISEAQKEETRHRLGLERPFFLFLGRLESKKNIEHIISAYVSYARRVPDPVDLVLAGSPGYGWEAAAQKIQPDVAEHIHQLGFVTDPDMRVLQTTATAFLMVSRYEGFGIPAAESLAAGVPVISSRAGSLPEVLGECAKFVDLDSIEEISSALDQVSRDLHLRQELTTRGRAWVQRYTWDQTAIATMEAIAATANLQI